MKSFPNTTLSMLMISLGVVSVLAACTTFATPPPQPAELANTEWVLDYILVKGEAQPPYSPYSDQTITFDDDLEYRAFDGCNEIFNCRKHSSGEKACEQTLLACRVRDVVTGQDIPTTWEGPFGAAILTHTWSQLKDGFLYWHTSMADDTILVFRSIDAKPTDATPAYPTATP